MFQRMQDPSAGSPLRSQVILRKAATTIPSPISKATKAAEGLETPPDTADEMELPASEAGNSEATNETGQLRTPSATTDEINLPENEPDTSKTTIMRGKLGTPSDTADEMVLPESEPGNSKATKAVGQVHTPSDTASELNLPESNTDESDSEADSPVPDTPCPLPDAHETAIPIEQFHTLIRLLKSKLIQLVELAEIEIDTDTHRSAPHLARAHEMLADKDMPTPIPLHAQDCIVHIVRAKLILRLLHQDGKDMSDAQFETFWNLLYNFWGEARDLITDGLLGSYEEVVRWVEWALEEAVGINEGLNELGLCTSAYGLREKASGPKCR